MYSIWWGLAWQEIKQRYTRSLIGPFWITLSMGIMIGAMGPLYGALFGQNVSAYVQHLAISLIIWGFISSTINDAGTVFTGAEGYIKQISLPLTFHVLKLLSRNLLIMAHNFLVGVVILIIIPPHHANHILLMPVGLFLVVLNLSWFVLLVGMLSARFRDIPQLVSNFVQVMFFLSPILWTAQMLSPSNRFLADFNPLFHLVEVVRAPLLGESLNLFSWIFCFLLLLLGWGSTFLIFVKLRPRVPYWL